MTTPLQVGKNWENSLNSEGNMTTPPNPKLKQPFRKKKSSSNIAKAYLRNFGKGQLEYTDTTLNFYVEKGRLVKKKEVAKNIPFADVESVILEKNELAVTWKGVTERFVVENSALAQLIMEKANEALKLREKSYEEQEAAVTQVRAELASTIKATLSVVDSLFDILRSLHGRVDWNRMDSFVNRSEKYLKATTHGEVALANLNFSLLSLALSDHNVEAVSKESYHLLESIQNSFKETASGSESAIQLHLNRLNQATVQSYYVLNDIVLASVVGDEKVIEEVNQLAVLLVNLSKETGEVMNPDEVLCLVNRLCAEHEKESLIKETRAVFKKQLKLSTSS